MKRFQELPLEKWTWIELIGFDRDLPDYGVGDFIRRAGFVPDGVSLLLTWLGFVMERGELTEERELAAAECSYFAHPACPERKRQRWTNFELRDLISCLHQAGCKVFLSFFDFESVPGRDGGRDTAEFHRNKLWLREKNRDESDAGGADMLKRLRDGSFYEDVLQEAAVRALVNYGFDGIQISDGISSPRGTLQESDYSPDMLEQFADATGIRAPAGEDAADWIWQNRRYDWIRFHETRWERFYRKFADRLKKAGKLAVFNSAWTRDPFEAAYRYGVDYRSVARLGFYGCMSEDTAAGLTILSERDNGYLMTDEQRKRVLYEFRTNLMLNRAAMPELKLLPLAGIHDMMEQWGVLEHMPTAMTTNVLGNLNCWYWQGGRLRPITDGPFFCLCDSMRSGDWDYVRAQWEAGFSETPTGVAGCTAIWSDARMDAELAAFCDRRVTPTQRLLSELAYAGCPVSAVARAEETDSVRGALLVTNPAFLPVAEFERVRSYSNGPVFLIGEGAEQPNARVLVREENAFGNVSLSVLGRGSGTPETIRNTARDDFDPKRSMEPAHACWTHPLTFSPISPEFFLKCADAVTELTNAPRVTDMLRVSDGGIPRRVCKYLCSYPDETRARVIVMNDDYYYNHPTLDFGRPVRSVRCVTRYEGYRVPTTPTGFTCRIAGRGADVFDVEFA